MVSKGCHRHAQHVGLDLYQQGAACQAACQAHAAQLNAVLAHHISHVADREGQALEDGTREVCRAAVHAQTEHGTAGPGVTKRRALA